MSSVASRDYYSKRAGMFAEYVRRFVPYYDVMVDKIIGLLQVEWPRRILDIGSGAGNIDLRILDTVPVSRIDCVEASTEMVKVSMATIGRNIDRAEIIHKNVMDFNPEGRYDAILSNLVLHNLTKEQKAMLLRMIRNWLVDGGLFIWGDLMKHESRDVSRMMALKRFRQAVRLGADKKMAEETLEREAEQDYPLTEEEMTSMAEDAGFGSVFVAWKRGSFAILAMRK